MTTPQPYTAKLEEKKEFNDKFVQLNFELEKPHTLEFQAGQYVSIQVDDKGTRRPYSICSSPAISHGFELLLDVEPQGLGTKYLMSLEFGATISLLAPMGMFTIAEELAEEELVLVATGSGIAPFRSMILDQLQVRKSPRPITLHWGMRFAHNLFWLDEFQELAESFPHFQFHPVISRPTYEWNLSRGRVTDVLQATEISQNAGYYLCGGKPMIEDVVKVLEAKGISSDRIHHEKFF